MRFAFLKNFGMLGWGYPQSALRLTAPSAEGAFWGRPCLRRRGGGQSPFGSFPIVPATPSAFRLSIGIRDKRWQVAAALSAAVTTTKLIGDEPHLSGANCLKKHTPQTPAALRERGSGGEGLLSEKPPLPQNLPVFPTRLLGREREGGDFSSEKSSPSHSHTYI